MKGYFTLFAVVVVVVVVVVFVDDDDDVVVVFRKQPIYNVISILPWPIAHLSGQKQRLSLHMEKR